MRAWLPRRVAAVVAGVVSLLLAVATPVATAGTALSRTPPAVSPEPGPGCAGVWVVVDATELGGKISTECATDHSTGLVALESAGFTTRFAKGMLSQIDGLPADGRIANGHYWSYWTATRADDGSYSEWRYASIGPSSSRPKAGNAEGWRFVATEAKTPPPPREAPPAGSDPIPPDAVSPSVPSTPDSTALPPAEDSTQPGELPWGVIVTAGVIVLGGAGLGAWWLTTGRRR